MITEERVQEIRRAFARYAKRAPGPADVEQFTLEELRSADIQLGEWGEGMAFRLALRNRIQDLERAKGTWRFWLGISLGFIGGVIATSIGVHFTP